MTEREWEEMKAKDPEFAKRWMENEMLRSKGDTVITAVFAVIFVAFAVYVLFF